MIVKSFFAAAVSIGKTAFWPYMGVTGFFLFSILALWIVSSLTVDFLLHEHLLRSPGHPSLCSFILCNFQSKSILLSISLSLSIFSHSTHLYIFPSLPLSVSQQQVLYMPRGVSWRNETEIHSHFQPNPQRLLHPSFFTFFSSNHINQSFPYLIYYPTHSNHFPVSEAVLHAISKKVIISQWLFTQVRLRNQNTVYINFVCSCPKGRHSLKRIKVDQSLSVLLLLSFLLLHNCGANFACQATNKQSKCSIETHSARDNSYGLVSRWGINTFFMRYFIIPIWS